MAVGKVVREGDAPGSPPPGDRPELELADDDWGAFESAPAVELRPLVAPPLDASVDR